MTETKDYKNLIKDYFNEEIKTLENIDRTELSIISLSEYETLELMEKISKLPHEEKSLLYMKYIFKETPSITGEILGIKNPRGRMLYLNKLLSETLGYENKYIEESIIEEAVKLAYEKEESERIPQLEKAKYTKTTKKKMTNIGIKLEPRRKYIPILKRVAVVFLIVTLSLVAFLSTNTIAREKLLGWFVETVPEYSVFTSDKESDEDTLNLTSEDITIGYIPDRFELEDIVDFHSFITYRYILDDNYWIGIQITKSKTTETMLDTEGVEIEEFYYNGEKAMDWKKGEISSLLVYINDVDTLISG